MSTREIRVESGVQLADESGAAAWCFDLDLWGRCTQGDDVETAVDRFRGLAGPVAVVEVVRGDEQLFGPDRLSPSPAQVERTREILQTQRARALSVLATTPSELLDRDDPQRRLPSWAGWRTIRQTLWHVVDTESRYYLPSLGISSRQRADDLERELIESAAHVDAHLDTLPAGTQRNGTEEWTAVKVLRRLAWHERGELDAVEMLLARWRDG